MKELGEGEFGKVLLMQAKVGGELPWTHMQSTVVTVTIASLCGPPCMLSYTILCAVNAIFNIPNCSPKICC